MSNRSLACRGPVKGTGRIKDNKNDRELYVQFSIKQNVASVALGPRPVTSLFYSIP